MMNKMSFHVISNVFSDLSLEHDRQKHRQTDRASYRGTMAHLKNGEIGAAGKSLSVYTLAGDIETQHQVQNLLSK